MWNDSSCTVAACGSVELMNGDVAAWGFLGMRIGAAMSNVATYVSGFGGWDDWSRFDEIGWNGICCIGDCCWSASVGCEVWKNGNCWNVDDCTDSIEISEIAEKDKTDLNTCCENAAKGAVTGANRSSETDAGDLGISENAEADADRNAKNAAESANNLGISEAAETNAGGDVENAVEKIFWWSRNFQYFLTTFSLASWSAHNAAFGNCNSELCAKLGHVSSFGHLMKSSLSNVLHKVFVINVFVFFSTHTSRFFRKSRSSRIFAFVINLKSFSV